MAPHSVGTSAKRKEGREKLCGAAKYIDDYELPGCWHGATYRSQIAAGRIKSISFEKTFPWDECVVVTAKDIPGTNVVALIEGDQPLLADGIVRHREEPILLVAHPSRQRAYEALKHVRVEYEPVAPALTIQESIDKKNLIWGPDNVQKSYLIKKGDVDKAMSRADFVVEGEYHVPHQEQAYIENNGVASWVDEQGVLVILGSMQCPYYVLKAMVKAFDRTEEQVRVVQSVTGGGFGGKEEYPSMISGHAALLALKAKRPVKLIYDRVEDMAATTKRHPAIVRHKTGVMRDGTLVAQDVDVIMDGGAYVTLSPVVLSRGTLHAGGPYECEHVRVRSRCMATNTPPNGAFRGFGAPQTLFAAELHMEKIAEALGMDALELRRLNLLREGSRTATGQRLNESVGASDCLEKSVKKSDYVKKRKAYDAWNKKASNPTWKGIGLAVCHHGAGFTGSGEVYLASKAGVALSKDGRVQVLAASTEMGQGATTIFAQIAADALQIPYDDVEVETPDTKRVPNSGPTVASRTTMIVGGLVRRACLELLKEIPAKELKTLSSRKRAAARVCGEGPLKKWIVEFEKPNDVTWDDKTYTGDAYGVYSYGCVVADLEIDKATYEVKLNKLVTAQDIGTIVNPLLANGQIIGGTTQALGYALLELPIYRDGVMINAQLTNYIIPTAPDVPRMDVINVEKPYSRGPFGAKGVGELPMDIPGPAVAAAVRHATGKWFFSLPILPEKICEAMAK